MSHTQAGQERFRSVTASSFRGSHGVIFCFDITDRESFLNVRRVWWDEVATKMGPRPEEVVKLLIGNKCDLSATRRAIPYQEAEVRCRFPGPPACPVPARFCPRPPPYNRVIRGSSEGSIHVK